jgi:molybdopterin converting factor small subunit
MKWWVVAVGAAGTVLLFAWLGRLAGVSPEVLWTVGAAFAALTWAAVLVTVPWNLYFGARRVVADQNRRDIEARPEQKEEARRIARGMLRFAIGGHLGTAAVAAAVAYVSGEVVGYYLAGFFLLSTLMRPASAYFAHLRQRIGALEREAAFPRDDVLTLKARVAALEGDLAALREQADERLMGVDDDLRRAAADLTHLRTRLAEDLKRLESTQASDRAAARGGDDELRRTIDRMVRRVDATLDGVSDHQELLTGLRALVRMIRSE